jgi:hypothetical protein
MLRFTGVVVTCDDPETSCEQRCSENTYAMQEGDRLRVVLPRGWTQKGETIFGPNCTEQHAARKILSTPLPDPEQDPPILKVRREKQMEMMRQVIREELRGATSEARSMYEKLLGTVRTDDGEPDFSGHVGESPDRVEVRTKGQWVEITWPTHEGMSLTLRQEGGRLIDPPPFLDAALLVWVQNGLRTAATGVVSLATSDDPVAH